MKSAPKPRPSMRGHSSKDVVSLSPTVRSCRRWRWRSSPSRATRRGLPAVAIKPPTPNLDELCRQQLYIGSFTIGVSTWNKSNNNKYSTLNSYPFDVLWPKYGILRAKIPFWESQVPFNRLCTISPLQRRPLGSCRDKFI
jgi:hypothetical protein